jgi:hypothetical protein
MNENMESYTEFSNYLLDRGWKSEHMVLDEHNVNFVSLYNLDVNDVGTVIDITVPNGKKMSVMGINQLEKGQNIFDAYYMAIELADSKNNEISLYTHIRVIQESNTETFSFLARLFYADINLTKRRYDTDTKRYIVEPKAFSELYRFRYGFQLDSGQHFKIAAVNHVFNCAAIDNAHIKLRMPVDIWNRR